MVVFEDGKPAKKEYRRFKLKTVQGKPDDFKSMAEIMERRYGNETDWPMPDLIIIDGGKGQLNAALPLIRAVGVTDVPVISLAKRIEEVFVEVSRKVSYYLIIRRNCSYCNKFVTKLTALPLRIIVNYGASAIWSRFWIILKVSDQNGVKHCGRLLAI